MKLTGHRLMALGVVLMTTYAWLLPALIWLVVHISPVGIPPKTEHQYGYSHTVHLVILIYLAGAFLAVAGGVEAAIQRYKRDRYSFFRFDFRELWTLDFLTKRLLIIGVQFLLAPIWCEVFVNEMAINIAAKNVGYGSFLMFDGSCVMLQYWTLTTLFKIGFYVTLAGAVVYLLKGWLQHERGSFKVDPTGGAVSVTPPG